MSTEPQPAPAVDFQQIADRVLSLPAVHRFELAQQLWDSLDEEIPIVESPEFLALLRRRVQEIEDGTAVLVDHDVVMRELRAKLTEQRCK